MENQRKIWQKKITANFSNYLHSVLWIHLVYVLKVQINRCLINKHKLDNRTCMWRNFAEKKQIIRKSWLKIKNFQILGWNVKNVVLAFWLKVNYKMTSNQLQISMCSAKKICPIGYNWKSKRWAFKGFVHMRINVACHIFWQNSKTYVLFLL